MIHTLTTNHYLYKVSRNRRHFQDSIDKGRTLFLTCCITAVVTFGVIAFIVRY